MKNKLVIDCCNECPHFSNVYYSYEESCTILKRKMKRSKEDAWFFTIPEDCPLDNADNENENDSHI